MNLEPVTPPLPRILPILDADYYLRNFELIVDTVLARDGDLFSPEELDALYRLRQLPEPLRRLYVRLHNRQGPLFRLDRLHYAEIPELPQVAWELAQQGFATLFREGQPLSLVTQPADGSSHGGPPLLEPLTPTSLALTELMDTFTMAELKPLAVEAGLPTTPRGALLAGLCTLDPMALAHRLLAHTPVLRLGQRALFYRLERLFFLRPGQDHTTLVTADLALVRYPRYSIVRTRPVFAHRAALEAWLLAEHQVSTLEAHLYLAQQGEGLASAVEVLGEAVVSAWQAAPPGEGHFLDRFGPQAVLARGVMHYAQWLEQARHSAQAAALYAQGLRDGFPERYRGDAWVRLALLQERLQGKATARETCLAGLADEQTRAAQRLALEQRLERIEGRRPKRRAGSPSSAPVREVVLKARLLRAGVGRRQRYENGSPEGLPVEEVALAAYRTAGMEGMYTENTFFSMLFTLFFWDELFAPLPDVFQSPYQDAPLDLGTDAFYPRRRAALEARLGLLTDPTPAATGLAWLTEAYERHQGTLARGVDWARFSLEALQVGATRLGGARLAVILRGLAEDYRFRRRGLPDLLLWQAQMPETDAMLACWGPQGYAPPDVVFLAEVKSSRDRLSPEQRAWLTTLEQGGVAVELCRIEEV